MRTIEINLRISADEFLRLYQGQAKDVVATAVDGRTVRFPARILQPYVSHEGIRGYFRIEFGEGGKFKAIECLSS